MFVLTHKWARCLPQSWDGRVEAVQSPRTRILLLDNYSMIKEKSHRSFHTLVDSAGWPAGRTCLEPTVTIPCEACRGHVSEQAQQYKRHAQRSPAGDTSINTRPQPTCLQWARALASFRTPVYGPPWGSSAQSLRAPSTGSQGISRPQALWGRWGLNSVCPGPRDSWQALCARDLLESPPASTTRPRWKETTVETILLYTQTKPAGQERSPDIVCPPHLTGSAQSLWAAGISPIPTRPSTHQGPDSPSYRQPLRLPDKDPISLQSPEG